MKADKNVRAPNILRVTKRFNDVSLRCAHHIRSYTYIQFLTFLSRSKVAMADVVMAAEDIDVAVLLMSTTKNRMGIQRYVSYHALRQKKETFINNISSYFVENFCRAIIIVECKKLSANQSLV